MPNMKELRIGSSTTPFNPVLSEKARLASRIPWNLTADDVQAWMDLQSIEILKSIYKVHLQHIGIDRNDTLTYPINFPKHAVWLLEQHGIECEDRLNLLMSERVAEDWFEGGSAAATKRQNKAALPGYKRYPLSLKSKYLFLSFQSPSATTAGEEVEPGEIWEPPAIPSLISMNVPPPPKSRSRVNNLQQQANQRWEQHKLTGWKGPDPPVRVQPQVHGVFPPSGRSRGAWKKGGTLHSVQPPHSTHAPCVRPPQVFI